MLASVLATVYSGSALRAADGAGCRRRAVLLEGTITTSGATPRAARRTPHPALPTRTSASTGQTAFKSAGTLRHGVISTRQGESREPAACSAASRSRLSRAASRGGQALIGSVGGSTAGISDPHDRDPAPGCPDERVVDRTGQELRLDAGVGADDQDLMPHVPTSGRTIMTRWRASATIRRTTWS